MDRNFIDDAIAINYPKGKSSMTRSTGTSNNIMSAVGDAVSTIKVKSCTLAKMGELL